MVSLTICYPPVFLDENNTVKMTDFGLSKALAQASFANMGYVTAQARSLHILIYF